MSSAKRTASRSAKKKVAPAQAKAQVKRKGGHRVSFKFQIIQILNSTIIPN